MRKKGEGRRGERIRGKAEGRKNKGINNRIISLTSTISSVSLKGAVSILNCFPGAEEKRREID